MQEHSVLTLFKTTRAWFVSQEQRQRRTVSYRQQEKSKLSRLRNAFFAAGHHYSRELRPPERARFNTLTSRLMTYTAGSIGFRDEFRCYPEPYLDNQDMAVWFSLDMARTNPEWFRVTRAFARFLREIGFQVKVRSRLSSCFRTYTTIFYVTLPAAVETQRTRHTSASSS